MSNRNHLAETGRGADCRLAPSNPRRPCNARHKATQAVLSLLRGEAEALSRKAIEAALSDAVAGA